MTYMESEQPQPILNVTMPETSRRWLLVEQQVSEAVEGQEQSRAEGDQVK